MLNREQRLQTALYLLMKWTGHQVDTPKTIIEKGLREILYGDPDDPIVMDMVRIVKLDEERKKSVNR